MLSLNLDAIKKSIHDTPLYHVGGRLKSATGLLTSNLRATLGEHCAIETRNGDHILCEVIGFENELAYLMPFDTPEGLQPGLPVIMKGAGLKVPTGSNLLGRVIDGLGRPLDKESKGPLPHCPRKSIHNKAPDVLGRSRIRKPFVTGIRAIDSTLTLGQGQRVGIFAGSGVGKSTLLGEIAKGSEADVNVIALIGERGLEVIPFIEDTLGPEGLARSVVIVATCESTPLMRVRATETAITIAETFREEGKNVLLMVDSLTRLALAQREIGLLRGEPPSSRGYTPSVFTTLSSTIERLGNSANGTMTALLTVLVDGGDMDEPVADAVRSFIDGHIVLDRKIAQKNIYPAIDISQSVSRVQDFVVNREHHRSAGIVREILTNYADVQDMIRVGAYLPGQVPQIDKSIELLPSVEKFLRQSKGERSRFEDTNRAMNAITSQWPW